MFGLFTALLVGAGFLLGLRVGIALGRRNEQRRLEQERERLRLK
jgi:hypothetical protein